MKDGRIMCCLIIFLRIMCMLFQHPVRIFTRPVTAKVASLKNKIFVQYHRTKLHSSFRTIFIFFMEMVYFVGFNLLCFTVRITYDVLIFLSQSKLRCVLEFSVTFALPSLIANYGSPGLWIYYTNSVSLN